MKSFKYLILLFLIGNVCTGCFDDLDDVRKVSSIAEINDFVWRGMNTFYLYKADVPDLANNRFGSDQERRSFLSSFDTPESLFESMKSDVDEFSWIVSDYVALELSLQGVTLNNGMDYGLRTFPNDENLVYAYVRYVLPNTDAEAKNISRGMIFTTVDGTQLTISNFRTLLRSSTYAIGLADFDGSSFTLTGESITLNKIQYTENPVYIAKTIDVGGNPVGYLMYNAFTPGFDGQLNAAFAKFKSDGITDLIIDLRYNGGGSVDSAIDLSSMITGQFNGRVFSTEQWNADRQAERGKTNFFDPDIRTGEAINSLNLPRVYLLTTNSSASASELVINGLDPYIPVIQVGTTTRGKFQASITVYDSKNFGRFRANLGHTYAMQPLVLKSLNSVGFTDYFDGFNPEVEIREDFTNSGGDSKLGILGNEDEPLLKTAINHILGKRSLIKNTLSTAKDIGESDMFNPSYQRMYITSKPGS